MPFIKYAAPIAAILAAASADDGCTFKNPTTLTAAGDVQSLATCQTIVGTIAFATGVFPSPTLALPQLAIFNGDWTLEGDENLQGVSAPSLQQISGAIKFQNLRSLSSINLQSLQKSGDVTLAGMASLQTVITGTQYSEAGAIVLSNTQLSTLGGFGNLTKITSIDVEGNSRLGEITMDISTVKTINIGTNEQQNSGLSVAFDNLTNVGDSISIQHAAKLSLAKLINVTNILNVIQNDFTSFSAPKLSSLGGFNLISNPQLTDLSLPVLTKVGANGFSIANNSKFTNIGGYDKLTTVQGGVSVVGVFKNASYANFQHINGSVLYSSTEDISDICNHVNTFQQSSGSQTQISQGKPTCSSSNAGAANNIGTASGSGSSGAAASSSGAAMPIDIPALPVLSAGLGAALLQFLLSF